MYNLIYYFIYYYHKTRQGYHPSTMGSFAVAMAAFFQSFFLLSLYSYLTGNYFLVASGKDYNTNMIYLFPFNILFFMCSKIYYNKERVRNLREKWKEKKVITFSNGCFILLVSFVPLFTAIHLLNDK